MLHKLVDNVTSERKQLQTSYNILTTKQDQLQTSYNNLTTNQDQLQTSYNNLVKERDQLQKRLEDVTSERNQLQTSYNNLTTERDQLQTIFNNLTTKHDQLQASYNNWTTEQDQLQNRSNNLVKERDQLQERLANMTANRDDLQKQLQDNAVIKFVDDTTVVGLISGGDETAYRAEVQRLSDWRVDNNLDLNTTKTKELVVNFRRRKSELQPVSINGECVERVSSFKFLDCRENWVAFSDSLYQVSAEKKSWEESRQDCRQKGSDLMIINSREEQNFVNQFKKLLWIGLTDSETEGTWKWVDGTQMNKSYWNRGEPNGGRNENCGHIDTYNSENSWNDATCSILHFWICEKRDSP
ncbi:C-type lectin domain family 4 member M-like [Pelmatolapia mariae]|uniref:C-type lectin domain family 4 member M-like n=1 Tax=Pelmatolapia mariae TaxID=158779 RepID=UPI003211CFFB